MSCNRFLGFIIAIVFVSGTALAAPVENQKVLKIFHVTAESLAEHR